jgi:hypothetical protein
MSGNDRSKQQKDPVMGLFVESNVALEFESPLGIFSIVNATYPSRIDFWAVEVRGVRPLGPPSGDSEPAPRHPHRKEIISGERLNFSKTKLFFFTLFCCGHIYKVIHGRDL